MHDNEHDEQQLVGVTKPPEIHDEVAAAPSLADLPAQMGNREFTRQVASPVQRSGGSQGAGPLDPDIESDIRSAQGGGSALDDNVRADMEGHLGADLSGVRVHADSRGDMLSRSVQADAFTTGSDVFFRSGKYSPDSSDGRKLLAHELTHVVQQGSGQVPDESRVSHPDDPHEREAAAVADSLGSSPAPSAETTAVSREAGEEEPEEEEMVSRQVSREEAPAEEEEPEEEMSVDREAAPEEEEVPEEESAP